MALQVTIKGLWRPELRLNDHGASSYDRTDMACQVTIEWHGAPSDDGKTSYNVTIKACKVWM